MAAKLLAYDPAEELLNELADEPSVPVLIDPDESTRLSPELVTQWIEDARNAPAEFADDPPPESMIRPVAQPATMRVPAWFYALLAVMATVGIALIAFTLVR
jgi:hypothetical protein